MATELGLLSLTHLHNLAQSQDNQNQLTQDQNQLQLNPNKTASTTATTIPTSTITTSSSTTIAPWMWNPKSHHPAEEDDSWEVRAFAEDTGNVMGTTWPPRSYTCAFCRREFRSAQALGGHMNVHRRDRARLHQLMPPPNSITNHPSAAVAAASSPSATASSGSFIIPTGEYVASGGGLCLLYHLPNPNGTAYACSEPPLPSPLPPTLLSASPYPPHDLLRPAFSPSLSFPGQYSYNNTHRSRHDGQYQSRQAEEPSESADNNGGDEELDLELRLGHGPAPI